MLVPAQPFPFAATSTDVVVATGAYILRGWALQESTDAAAAALTIRDGVDVNGRAVAPITLAQNESTRDWLSGAGIGIRTGLFLDVTAGSVVGVLYASPVDFTAEGELVFSDWL